MSGGWPERIAVDNEFAVRYIDFETFDFPKLEIRTVKDSYGLTSFYGVNPVRTSKYERRLMAVPVSESDPSLHAFLVMLAEDWNEDPRTNWLREWERCARFVADHTQKKVDAVDQMLADALASAKLLEAIKAMAQQAGVTS